MIEKKWAKKVLIELAENLANVSPTDEKIISQFEELVTSNELEKNEDIPIWFVNFFQSIFQGENTGKVKFDYWNTKGEIFNFLEELEEVFDLKVDDYGEGKIIEFDFERFAVQAFFSFESFYYEIKKKESDNFNRSSKNSKP